MTDLFAKVYGSMVTAWSLRGQERVPYLPREQVWALRDRRLAELVRYAATTVPYYRELFSRLSIDPADIQTTADLDRLPLLDKQTVSQDPERFRSSSKRGRAAVRFPTSGTTGSPLILYHDQHSLFRDAGFNRRERAPMRKLLGPEGVRRTLAIGHPGGTTPAMRRFLGQHRFRSSMSNRLWLSVADPVDKVIAAINDFQPNVVNSFGSYLEALFRMAAAGSIRFHLPRAVRYYADGITDAGKRLIEETFGVAVMSSYSAVEAFKIGFTCEQRSGFHLHEDLIHVKIVDGYGKGVGTGEKGEVVISNLVNHGTVLLNYRLGDVAALTDERCPCGRSLVLLSDLEGRVEDIVYLADGQFVHPRLIWNVFKHRSGVLRYQLIQHDLTTFELRLATVDRGTFETMIDEVSEELRGYLGASVSLEAVYQAEFRPFSGGKFRPVLSLLEDKGSSAAMQPSEPAT